MQDNQNTIYEFSSVVNTKYLKLNIKEKVRAILSISHSLYCRIRNRTGQASLEVDRPQESQHGNNYVPPTRNREVTVNTCAQAGRQSSGARSTPLELCCPHISPSAKSRPLYMGKQVPGEASDSSSEAYEDDLLDGKMTGRFQTGNVPAAELELAGNSTYYHVLSRDEVQTKHHELLSEEDILCMYALPDLSAKSSRKK